MDLLRKTHEESLLSLRAEFEGERSSEMNRLSQRYDIDVADLSHSLSKRTEELKGLQLSHSSLLNAISEKERHLESVKGNLNQLKGELRQCHDDLTTVKSERDLLKEETNRLKVSPRTLDHVHYMWSKYLIILSYYIPYTCTCVM